MWYSNPGSFRAQASFLRRQFLQDGELPFTNVLAEEVIAEALTALGGWMVGSHLFSAGHPVGDADGQTSWKIRVFERHEHNGEGGQTLSRSPKSWGLVKECK